MQTPSKVVAIDPATGCYLRDATPEEIAAFNGQKLLHGLWAFRKAVRVGDVLVDEDNGPGIWFGGAGF